ncbi:alpha/beta fold hydrolase [Nocardia colli]|uniref:alpha/beta fold hydrolase n=1 Tax=Nocardia colli TaxID=2545717 RepID=UPI0035D9F354
MISEDGTSIAYDRCGSGPAVVLVGGGLDDGTENAPLAQALAEHFTVYNYARRGRGNSGHTSAHDLALEIEDLAALIAEAGGRAHLYGVSTGGALALEAAAAGCSVARLGVYEIPYNATDSDWPQQWRNYVDELQRVLAAGRRADAIELFMRVTGASDADLAGLRTSPYWPELEKWAHTLAYDAAVLGDGRPPLDRLAHVRQPVLVLTGDDRPAGAAQWIAALDDAADTIAAHVPHAERQTVKGQGHVADPHAVAPILERFYNEDPV